MRAGFVASDLVSCRSQDDVNLQSLTALTSPSRYESIRIRVAQTSLEAAERLAAGAPRRGLRQVQRLIDAEIQRLPRADRGPLACKAGCDFCCHLRVMATPVEVFALLEFIRDTFSEDEFTALADRVIETDDRLRKLPADRVLTTNLPCPVLIDGRCSAYAARPLNCRSYHSLSRQACEESFDNPGDLGRGHPELTAVANVHAGAQAGFQAAFERAGFDQRQYELVTALAEALQDDQARARFERGEPAFNRPSLLP